MRFSKTTPSPCEWNELEGPSLKLGPIFIFMRQASLHFSVYFSYNTVLIMLAYLLKTNKRPLEIKEPSCYVPKD